MSNEMLIAIISLTGTLVGSFAGILTANRLVNFRIDRIEESLNYMDQLDKRLDKVETTQLIHETILESIKKDIDRDMSVIKELHTTAKGN